MSTTTTAKGGFTVPNMSKQVTKMTPVSTKLEWRIEHTNRSPAKRSLFHIRWQSHGDLMYIHMEQVNTLRMIQAFIFTELDSKRQKLVRFLRIAPSTGEEKMTYKNRFEFQIDTKVRMFEEKDITKTYVHPDGSLVVICEVESLLPEETCVEKPTLGLLDQNLQLADNFKEMWKSQLFTDCIIKVGTKSFPAHKCILSQWREVFRKMFSLPTDEAASGIVEITDFGPDAINAMLEYMYTGAVKDEVMDNLASDLLTLADKYAMIPLKETCEVFLASKLTTTNFLQLIILADRFSAIKLRKACVDRLATDGRAALQSKEWEDFRNDYKDLANELLELMIKDPPGCGDVIVDVEEARRELASKELARREYLARMERKKKRRALAFWR